ncbi:G-type lectin S-receptor-like serine/threonine-protein kinase LECRK3 [Citrus sinensis]|uniref:G-type lectin S-receptor-like serine/threonine-protein kinase LECRK3 n=1 Tax=Citrus sinensis TaxID=2711 RepID=A0ACB8LUL8_CITSI|nr:G-type lectin S-receptor-like serine/threonine-protein kinase LECRK3 [Citrus sinensis]
MDSLALSCLILLCFPLLPFLSAANNITLGSSLSSTSNNSSWLSPSGDFAFGFGKLNNNSDLFLLSIWFNKIPERTIIWHANEDNHPVLAPRGSTLELTATGLLLKDPGGQAIWDEKPNKIVSDAAMLDTGNFVLIASGNHSDYAWESFKSPTDTILPTQILDLGSVLVSRLTETNLSKGRFELHFSNGSLEFIPVAWPSRFQYKSYYTSNTSSANSSESGHQLVFNESADIYIVKNNGQIVQLPLWAQLSPRADHYFRATLDFDGVFAEYAHSKNSSTNQGWFPTRTLPDSMCTRLATDIGSGICGFNSYCSLQNGRPFCDCPPGYVLVDPNNRFRGCKPNFWQGFGPDDGSRNAQELYEIREFNNVDWPLGDYERLEPSNQTECEISCLQDCSCAVAIYDGNRCWKKKLPLSNGWLRDTEFSKVLFKVRKGDFPAFSDNSGSKKERGPLFLLGAFLLGGSILCNAFLLLAILIFFKWRRRKYENNVQDSTTSATNLRFFSYDELKDATDGFKEELGRGSFGIVYKGVLKTASGNAIAVKKLDRLAQEREREFKSEVSAIGRTHHKNLVQLLGFCDEALNRLLVYEFMGNGTLANLIFAIPKPDWNLRVRISLEIARGLVYLHEGCNVPIIHCDIKPQNILLDHYFSPKISDFGLSKLLLSDHSRTHTMIRGTRGYVAPEWLKNAPVSAKVDVYSFGVMLLEIICCRKSVEMELEEEGRAILTDWAYDCYVEGRLDALIDSDEAAMADRSRLHKWLMIAMWCIQEDPSKRPTMKVVMQMLEGLLEVPNPPWSSSFSIAVTES